MSEPCMTVLASPIGPIGMVIDGETLEILDFIDGEGRFDDLLARRYPQGVRRSASDPSGIADRITAYLGGHLDAIETIPTRPSGTAFQQSVWRSLRTIPCGATISYAELARRVGRPRASRAVGQANGRNPIAIVHPCHRVIGADGTLTGTAAASGARSGCCATRAPWRSASRESGDVRWVRPRLRWQDRPPAP